MDIGYGLQTFDTYTFAHLYHRNIVIETKPAEDLSGASNLYILVSEEAS